MTAMLVSSPTPVIAGPTAGGKSDLAVALALHFRDRLGTPAEIITADSVQVYRGLDIGSAKPTAEERRGVPHHLIDIKDPDPGQPAFTVDEWLRLANLTIADLRARNIQPIVVGGTHLYIKALLDGLFEGPEPDPALRAQLTAMDPAARRAELERADPAAAARIHPNDIRRTVRALEVFRLTGKPISSFQKQWDASPQVTSNYLLVVLDWETEALNRRINARVKSMLDRGLLAETRALFDAGRFGTQAAEALGYKQLLTHLRGQSTLEEAVEQIKIETRRFAKNQRTWLRRLRATPGALALPQPATFQDAAISQIVSRLGGSV
jgi:tRNA dimethylallyltransferase